MNLIPHIEKDPCELSAPGHGSNNSGHPEVPPGESFGENVSLAALSEFSPKTGYK